FKGLGEMMANQLKETTMDRKKRTLLRVVVVDDERKKTDSSVERLMGNKPEARFEVIQERAEFEDEEMLDVERERTPRQCLNRRRVRRCRQRFGRSGATFRRRVVGRRGRAYAPCSALCPRGDPSSRNLTQVWRLFHRGGIFIPALHRRGRMHARTIGDR